MEKDNKENEPASEYGALGGLLEPSNKLINWLETEYKLLRKFHLSGVVVLPHLDDIKIWDGTLFIRQGLYKGGIFKFRMVFPSDYPNNPPKVTFDTYIYHPLIHKDTREYDIKHHFNPWKKGK